MWMSRVRRPACTENSHRVGSLMPASRTRRLRNWPVFQGFDLPPEATMVASWAGPRVPTRVSTVGLHRPNPVASRNARFYWVFRTSRSGGGEGGILTHLNCSPHLSF
jgi:hypothetical protein